MMPDLIAGVDGGGSGCRARIYRADGTPLGQGSGGRANLLLGVASVRASVDEAIAQALGNSGLALHDRARLRVGLALASAEHEASYHAFLALPHPYADQILNTDALGACLAVNRGQDAGVVIAGTGSCALVWHQQQITRYGGHEFPISDQGSGARLGLAALQHTYTVQQGWAPPSLLSQRIAEQLADRLTPFGDPLRSPAWQRHASPGDVARFARAVFDCANENDSTAEQLLRQSAQEITRLLTAVTRHNVHTLAMMGSIGLHIRPWLSDAWQKRLTPPLGDAMEGARLIACHNLVLYPPDSAGAEQPSS